VFTDAVRRREDVVLIAGGIGITPVRALMEHLHGDVVVLYRVVHEGEAIFRDELERIAAARGISFRLVAGDHATPAGARLLSADHLRKLVPDIAARDVYVCGPPAMTDAIERNVRSAGVPASSIHVERFAL
jgi:ferredoxin-NADP reductase